MIRLFKRSYFRARRSFEPTNIEPGQYPHLRVQPTLDGQKTFAERLSKLNYQQDVEKINIGQDYKAPKMTPLNKKIKKNPNLEKLAREKRLEINLENVLTDDMNSPLFRLSLSRHYGIYESLFNINHYFVPIHHINILHKDGSQVHMGNVISPLLASREPTLNFSNLPSDKLYTLLMVCPDESVTGGELKQVLHYSISNINPKTSSGDMLTPYLQPIPYYGTGYHRYIYVLYEQGDKKMDFPELVKPSANENTFIDRDFSMYEFYKKYQDQITPVGVQFFQSEWDQSVRETFRTTINIPEPIYKIKFSEELPPPQSEFPDPNNWASHRRHPDGHPLANKRFGVFDDVSFNEYLDRYRDRKEIMEEVVLERLKMEGNPLDSNETSRIKHEFPMALDMDPEWPSWRKKVEEDKRLRRKQWKHLDDI